MANDNNESEQSDSERNRSEHDSIMDADLEKGKCHETNFSSSAKRKRNNSSEEDQLKDGGWGWMCVIGCCFMHIIMVGMERMYGMIYADVMELFDSPKAAAVAGVGGLCSALRLGLAPLASVLSNRFSPRVVVMAGAIIFAVGVMSSAFPPSVGFLYFSWGVLVGAGGALVYTPSFIILPTYFTRRLALANGISTAGSGIGLAVLPPLYALLAEHYNYTWRILIFGAISLNLLNCGALYRRNKIKDLVPAPEAEHLQQKSDRLDEKEIELNEDSKRKMHNQDHMNDSAETHSCIEDTAVKSSKSKKPLLDFRLFLSIRFDLYLLSAGLMAAGCMPIMTFLPPRLMEQGFTRTEAAFALTILGIPDFLGRVVAGLLFSMVPRLALYRRYFMGVLQFLMMLPIVAIPSLTSLTSYYVVMIIYGFFMGMGVALLPTCLTDWVRVGGGDTASGLGFVTCCRGVGIMVGPVVGGWMKDISGDLGTTFYFLGAVVLASAVVQMVLVIIDRVSIRRHGHDH